MKNSFENKLMNKSGIKLMFLFTQTSNLNNSNKNFIDFDQKITAYQTDLNWLI